MTTPRMRPYVPLFFFALSACVHASPPEPAPPSVGVGYPGTLRDPATHEHNFMLRQHAKGNHEGGSFSFDAVVQKNGAELLVLVLTPYGSRALLVKQTGHDVQVETFIDRELPFAPESILLDVQRVFLKGQPAPHEDGWTQSVSDGETVRERWQEGRLYRREFTRLDNVPPGVITVTYEGGFKPGSKPPSLTLDNGWFGYSLTLETSDYHPL
ncbi:MAG: DUF3261 domain-containing protein [Nannocystaceae bacterium]|nr:DUF3261 domain-containing protein [Nannocystaceae bacterium]